MTKIKICGIKRMEDINYINNLQPDYAGFIFAKSKRRVDMEFGKNLIKQLSSNIKKVGVFVNEDYKKVEEFALKLNLDVLQFHGEEDSEYIRKFKGCTIWKAIKVSNNESLENINKVCCDKFLLDNSVAGSGESFDWNLLNNKISGSSIILAGGLNINNVEDGIRKINPFAVDVSTGVEVDGCKNFNKIKEFIMKVRALE